MIRTIFAPFYFIILVLVMALTSVSFTMFVIGVVSILANLIVNRRFNPDHLKTALAGVIMPWDITKEFIYGKK